MTPTKIKSTVCTLQPHHRDACINIIGPKTKGAAKMTWMPSSKATDVSRLRKKAWKLWEIPKDKIFEVMREINRVIVTRPVGCGDAVILNVLGLGVDIVAASGILKYYN